MVVKMELVVVVKMELAVVVWRIRNVRAQVQVVQEERVAAVAVVETANYTHKIYYLYALN